MKGQRKASMVSTKLYFGVRLFLRTCFSVCVLALVVGGSLQAEEPSQGRTIAEHERMPGLWTTEKSKRLLGTKRYTPTEKEPPFFERLAPDERVTGDILMLRDYSVTGKVGEYVAWFGIVRGIEESKETTELLVEMKYFDGLTDMHLMAVSSNGAGDFAATLSGTRHGIKPVSLVKVHGDVVMDVKSVPHVSAWYVRHWDWGTFTFIMAYGEQKGNTAWRKFNKVPLDGIYDPSPNSAYYEKRLGKRPSAPLKSQQAPAEKGQEGNRPKAIPK